jgi:hypothetical protein
VARRVFMHIGAPKSGSTYVQTLLWANRTTLTDAGVLIPGRTLFDHNLASIAARGHDNAQLSRRAAATWDRLLNRTRRWKGDVVLSNEWYCWADADRSRAAIEALAPAEVHLVFTARPIVHQVPAAWQETLKVGLAQTVEEFVDHLDKAGTRWSWSTIDPAESLLRWARPVKPDRVHLVTVPPRGSDRTLLWRRVCQVLGVEADDYDTSTAVANESLGVEAAVLLQRMGPALRAAIVTDDATWVDQYRWIREYFAHDLLVPRGGHPIAVGSALAERLRARARQSADVLAEQGYDVVGSLDELLADDIPADAREPDSVTDAELLEIATPLVAHLLGEIRRRTRQAEAVQGGTAKDAGDRLSQ